MLLAIKPGEGCLSDINDRLINCYKHVCANPDRVAACLREHLRNHSEDHYYEVRSVFNAATDSAAQAARFIYINKTCFNGIYRVNENGVFNVPYGHKDPPALPSRQSLRVASIVLKKVELRAAPYTTALDEASEGDFVYLDPPYPPLNGTSYFTHYTVGRFAWDDHMELADTYRRLSSLGCLVMMSNADVPKIRKLFSGLNVHELDVIRFITCRNIKHRVRELVITNYPS